MLQIGTEKKIVIVTVGVPGSGKSYLSNKICRYINWLGYDADIFSIGQYRRQLYGTNVNADFFDPFNKYYLNIRHECGKKALSDLALYLNKEDSNLAIYDGTNISRNRRYFVKDTLTRAIPNVSIIFIESILTNQNMQELHIRHNLIEQPDFKDMNQEEAVKLYRDLVITQKRSYETIGDDEKISYIKIYNSGEDYAIKDIQGYLQSKILTFVMNLQFIPQTIYFTRHGQSIANVEHRVGLDSDLSEDGYKYAKCLNEFFQTQFDLKQRKNLRILTSTLKRAMITASHIKLGIEPIKMRALEEISVGICDGMTYDEIEEKHPVIHNQRKKDKLGFRYPFGESYLDLIQRLEPIIFEFERSSTPVIIVAHQAVNRCLYAYFTNSDKSIMNEMPNIEINLNTVYKLCPKVYQTEESRFLIDIETGQFKEEQIQAWQLVQFNKIIV